MVFFCKKQRVLKRLSALVGILWLFVCTWCALTHFKSHSPRHAASSLSLTLGAEDSCALCALESLPVCLAEIAAFLPAPVFFVGKPSLVALPCVTDALAPHHATRGPPCSLS